MKNIAILVSGSGTNMENIIRYFEGSSVARISLVVSDNPDAYALIRAKNAGVRAIVIPRAELRKMDTLPLIFKERGIDLIVLAGFLSLIPAGTTWLYENRIINIHPALLPKYGGKGMYGMHVHEAVIANGESESGITIHYVNEFYDEGGILAQFTTIVAPDDTPESLAEKIHALEYEHYPKIIEQEILEMDRR